MKKLELYQKEKNGVKKVWNAMILEKRKEQSYEHDEGN